MRRVISVLGATKRRAMDSVVTEDKSFKLVHEDSVIDMSVDGDMLATGCSGAKVALWNLETQECVRVLRGHHNGIRSVFLRGDLVLSGSRDKTVRLWSAATGQTLRHVVLEQSAQRELMFPHRETGKYMALLWDASSFRRISRVVDQFL